MLLIDTLTFNGILGLRSFSLFTLGETIGPKRHAIWCFSGSEKVNAGIRVARTTSAEDSIH